MTPQQLGKMFEPFFSTKIGRGGTGLGMAIVQNLVNKTLHGRVDVESTPGQGTCFTIRIPRVLPNA
ncbi:MAG: HAMP domain-containing histidine kinase, partial [Burkholderiaceae bacterium]|nr:HAMP domain-containing histidine kinase [Burkholderiaceae bacterium]